MIEIIPGGLLLGVIRRADQIIHQTHIAIGKWMPCQFKGIIA
jgi:hypothetical protein